MKKDLYLIRHGETLFNLHHRIQGACDSPLTAKGISQAKATGQYLKDKHIQFDHAYASTQERASDTLEYITSQPYMRLKGLKEWNFGDYEGENDYLNPPLDPKRHSYGDQFLAFHGESDLQVQERMNQTLLTIMKKEDHQKVIVLSHGGAIFMFLKKWVDEATTKTVAFTNCCILHFQFDGEQFQFIESIHEHLQNIKGR